MTTIGSPLLTEAMAMVREAFRLRGGPDVAGIGGVTPAEIVKAILRGPRPCECRACRSRN